MPPTPPVKKKVVPAKQPAAVKSIKPTAGKPLKPSVPPSRTVPARGESSAPGFFRVFLYILIFSLLGLFTWACIELNNPSAWWIMLVLWGIVLFAGWIIKLLSLRKTYLRAVKTAWWAFVLIMWIAVFLDTAACGLVQVPQCEPTFSGIASGSSYSILILSLLIGALYFPWALPVLYVCLRAIPFVFDVIGIPFPGFFSLIGRVSLLVPIALLTLLAYWTWFSLLPRAWSEIIAAIHVERFKSKSSGIFSKTWQAVSKGAKTVADKAVAATKASVNFVRTQVEKRRQKKEEEAEEKKTG